MDPKLALYEDLLPKRMGPKAQSTFLHIIRCSIKVYAQKGIDRVTFEDIAAASAISRPLILRYFKNYDLLFEACIKFARIEYVNYVVEQIKAQPSGEKQFAAYVRASIDYPRAHRSSLQLWLFFFYQCARLPKYKKLNSEVVSIGHRRITALLQGFHPRKSEKDLVERAKVLQIFLSGLILHVGTESDAAELNHVNKHAPHWARSIGDLDNP